MATGRFALVLFDWDGCTALVDTKKMEKNGMVNKGEIYTIRVEGRSHKVEILECSEDRDYLNNFEEEWSSSDRSKALDIEKEKRGASGNFLAVLATDDQNQPDQNEPMRNQTPERTPEIQNQPDQNEPMRNQTPIRTPEIQEQEDIEQDQNETPERVTETEDQTLGNHGSEVQEATPTPNRSGQKEGLNGRKITVFHEGSGETSQKTVSPARHPMFFQDLTKDQEELVLNLIDTFQCGKRTKASQTDKVVFASEEGSEMKEILKELKSQRQETKLQMKEMFAAIVELKEEVKSLKQKLPTPPTPNIESLIDIEDSCLQEIGIGRDDLSTKDAPDGIHFETVLFGPGASNNIDEIDTCLPVLGNLTPSSTATAPLPSGTDFYIGDLNFPPNTSSSCQILQETPPATTSSAPSQQATVNAQSTNTISPTPMQPISTSIDDFRCASGPNTATSTSCLQVTTPTTTSPAPSQQATDTASYTTTIPLTPMRQIPTSMDAFQCAPGPIIEIGTPNEVETVSMDAEVRINHNLQYRMKNSACSKGNFAWSIARAVYRDEELIGRNVYGRRGKLLLSPRRRHAIEHAVKDCYGGGGENKHIICNAINGGIRNLCRKLCIERRCPQQKNV